MELAGAYFETGRPGAHLHEEWQFAVPEAAEPGNAALVDTSCCAGHGVALLGHRAGLPGPVFADSVATSELRSLLQESEEGEITASEFLGLAARSVSLRDVASVAGVTVSHLVRSFSRSVGLPPESCYAQLRLARTRRLLAMGQSATWVAYECGFADQSHPSRRFEQVYGITPGTFQHQSAAGGRR